jgi:hypothetical protein
MEAIACGLLVVECMPIIPSFRYSNILQPMRGMSEAHQVLTGYFIDMEATTMKERLERKTEAMKPLFHRLPVVAILCSIWMAASSLCPAHPILENRQAIPHDRHSGLICAKMKEPLEAAKDPAREIDTQRVLPQHIILEVITALRAAQPLTVQIHSVMGDSETFSLASQLRGIFVEAGWPLENDQIQQTKFRRPQHGLKFILSEKPNLAQEKAFVSILGALGQEDRLYLNTKLPKGTVQVIVGSK